MVQPCKNNWTDVDEIFLGSKMDQSPIRYVSSFYDEVTSLSVTLLQVLTIIKCGGAYLSVVKSRRNY